MNKPENTRLFNEVGEHRDREMQRIKPKDPDNIVDYVENLEESESEIKEVMLVEKSSLIQKNHQSKEKFQKPKNLEGYLLKNSGNFFVGWQV